LIPQIPARRPPQALLELSLKDRVIPVVMSGGSGTRLWPLSGEGRPKQFHALGGDDRSLLQQSVARLEASDALAAGPPVLISNQRHLDLLRDQLGAVGAKPAALILEPFGRNTAAVGVLAALAAQEIDPEALVLLMPADHVVSDAEAFSATVAGAATAARDHIVTFGVQPTAPETGYGYVEAGEPLRGPVRRVARFAEKPDLETAKAYLESGRYLWNAGIFLFSPAVLLAEMERFEPQVVEFARLAFERARRQGDVVELDAGAFADCPSISIDYALMERTGRAAVAPLSVGWADVGSWSEVWRLGPQDADFNYVRGDALLIDVKDTLVWSEDRMVGAIGVSDLIIVQTDEAVIVLPKARAQDVTLLVEQVKARARLGGRK
jgi:mannose-1-phosphate guanylyltransferase/mannose-6-phosphate isomerase